MLTVHVADVPQTLRNSFKKWLLGTKGSTEQNAGCLPVVSCIELTVYNLTYIKNIGTILRYGKNRVFRLYLS